MRKCLLKAFQGVCPGGAFWHLERDDFASKPASLSQSGTAYEQSDQDIGWTSLSEEDPSSSFAMETLGGCDSEVLTTG